MTRKIDPKYEDHLFEKLIHSSDPEHLASYIEQGGFITDGLRDHLAKLIRERAPKQRGNADRLRDIDVYEEVERWRKEQVDAPIREEIQRTGLEGNEAVLFYFEAERQDLPPLQKAFRHLADKGVNAGVKIHRRPE